MSGKAPTAPEVGARLRALGIRRAKIPIPVPVPPTNAWVIGSGELTMVDCGARWGDAVGLLAAQVGQGERVENLLVTHGHPDHHGAAAALVAVHACKVFCHPFDASAVRDFAGTTALRFRRWAEAAGVNGAPLELIEKMEGHYRTLGRLGADVKKVEPLENGARIQAGGLELEAIHLPGHTAGSLAFIAREERVLFSGDSVLPGITPNPFFEGLYEKASGPGPFLESLHKLRALEVDLVLPGHGEPLEDLPAVLDLYERHHRERRGAIVAFLEKQKRATGFEIMGALFPNAGTLDQWLAIAEVVGHLQHLESLGKVEAVIGQGGRMEWRSTA